MISHAAVIIYKMIRKNVKRGRRERERSEGEGRIYKIFNFLKVILNSSVYF